MLTFVILFAALAVLGPLFGADSRDSLDWARDNFWMRRRQSRSGDSHAQPDAARVAEARRRTIPAAG